MKIEHAARLYAEGCLHKLFSVIRSLVSTELPKFIQNETVAECSVEKNS